MSTAEQCSYQRCVQRSNPILIHPLIAFEHLSPYIVGFVLVRFPNSHGCELGERRVCTRGIFLQWPIVAKIFIESGQLRTELACSTRDLALSHWPNSQKCTGCGCRAVFLPSSSLPLALLRFATCIFRIFSTGFLSDSCSIFVSAVKLHAFAFTFIPSHGKSMKHEPHWPFWW